MHSKGLWRTDSEEFSAHPEPSRTPAAHARGRPASSSLLCELLDRILAVVRDIALSCRRVGREGSALWWPPRRGRGSAATSRPAYPVRLQSGVSLATAG